MEMAKERQLLNEISTVDAWNRFYKDKIPQHIYQAIMKGADKMTPFHKACLDAYVAGNFYSGEDVEGNACQIGNAWERSSMDAKQLMIRISESYYDGTIMFGRLAAMAERVSKKKGHTESNYCERGYHIIFENEGLLVTCTTSYSASKKYYGDTHWCTASDIFGNYNGYERFGEYGPDEDAILLQFVDKKNRENAYQYAYGGYGDDVICDFFDKTRNIDDLAKMVYTTGGVTLETILHDVDYESLANETRKLYSEEDDYWNQKRDAGIKKIITKNNQNYNSGQYNQSLFNLIREAVNDMTPGMVLTDIENEAITMRIFRNPSVPQLYVANVDYWGSNKWRGIFFDLEESTDEPYHPFEVLLVNVDGDNVEIKNRIKNAWAKYQPGFVMVSYDNYCDACDWNTLKPFAEGEITRSEHNYTIFAPKWMLMAGFPRDERRAWAVNNETGRIDFEVESVDWYSRIFTDTEGNVHRI